MKTKHLSVAAFAQNILQCSIIYLNRLSPLADLAIRLYIAQIFWKAGLNKIQSWDSTLFLFQYEYQVPLLSPTLAAYLGTAVELSMPVLLAVGLATRFSALTLFVFNIVAVIAYPGLNPAGVEDHKVWGLLLLAPLLHGPGVLSIDHLIRRKFWRG